MAVHKEHTLKSFPSFPEIENFDDDDDDYDNNFIISLEDNGDEDDFYHATPVCTSVPYISNSTTQNGSISNVPYRIGAEVSAPSDEYCKDTLTYSQSQMTQLRTNDQPGLYTSSKESIQPSYRHSLNSSFSYPRSDLQYEINDQKTTVAPSCSNNMNVTTISKMTAGTTDSSQLISRNVPAYSAHSENRNHEHQSRKLNVSQQNLSTSYSELPKMHLETIHLDKEAGGIWSEAVFLNTTEISDSSFPDFGSNAAENKTTYLPISNNNIVPKLSGPYLRVNNPQVDTDCNVYTGSVDDSLSERVLKMQVLNGNASCSCVMCYKGKGNFGGFQKSHNEDPRLTKAEKLFIFNKPAKRKKLTASATDNAKEKPQSHNLNFDISCPQVLAISVNNALKTQNVLSYVSKPVASALPTTSHISRLDGLNSSKATQLVSSSLSDTAGQKIIILDMSKQFISANALPAHSKLATDRATTSYLQCEPLKPVTLPVNVSSALAVIPTVPRIISIPRLSSCPTKVFLKPSEVPGQKSQVVSSALELNSSSTLSFSVSSQTSSVQTQVSSNETASKYVSSAYLSSPPSNNVLYVSSDQMFYYQQQTKSPVNKQPQVKASNTSRISVIQLPSGNTPSRDLPTDAALNTCNQSILNQNSLLYLNKQNNLNSPVKTFDTSKSFRQLLNNTEKVDMSRPGKVIIKPQQSFNNVVTHAAQIHTSPVETTTTGSTTSSPVNRSYVHMRSLLKDSPQARSVLPSAPTCFSNTHSVNTQSGYLASKIQPSPGLGTLQTHVRLIKPVAQERSSASSDNTMVNVFRAGLQTSKSSTINSAVHSSQVNGNGISKTFHHTLILKPMDTQAYKSPPERDKNIQSGMVSSPKKVSSPHLPQEGLPSTYIEDWVSKATTYVSEQLGEKDCIQETHNFIPPFCDGHGEDLLSSSRDDPKESVTLNFAKGGNRDNAIFEMPESMETVLSKQEAKNQVLLRSPACADFQTPNRLQVLQSDSSCKLVSLASSVSTTSIGNMSIQEQLDHSSTLHRSGKKLMSSALHKKSQDIVSTVQNNLLSESGEQTSLASGDTSEQQLCKSMQSSSSILNSSTGIKLKIKLGTLRNEKTKHKQCADVAESNVRNAPLLQSTGELYLKECVNINADNLRCDSDKQNHNAESSDKIETAEEMFQRFQEQAVQEVVKAQLGMGYVSRSLRPARTSMAFLDKYPYRFESGKRKKKGLNEKNISTVSETSRDSNNCKIDNLTEASAMNKQLHVPHKRQVEETVDKEVKSKQPKLSIEDYPKLKQDCSITEGKTVYCTNILAGHKVYVKFNTFENMCSERAFLVPFFNIGGSRTQFDVEDMGYINKAVIDFESEDRSCARHLLFYSRAGNKAVFLRKETNLQASHINDKSYRKCSFVLEGFKRNTKKQTESSPEQWKVDNMVDIEIDRAEIDNDIETEFNTNLSLDEVAVESAEGRKSLHTLNHSKYKVVETPSLNICANIQSPLPSQDKHSGSIETGAYFRKVNEPTLLITDGYMHGTQPESDNVSEMGQIAATVPFTSEFSDSVIHSDQRHIYASHFQGSLNDIQNENTGERYEQHMVCSNMCTVVKEEVLIDEINVPHPLGQVCNPAWIKKEKVDVEGSIQRLDSSHPACNISSENSSPHPDICGKQILDENMFIKDEPLDDYFNSFEETGHCSLGDNRIEVQHITNLSCGHLTNISKIPVQQQKPADHTVNLTSEEVIISNTIANTAQNETSDLHSRLNDLQDHITERSITASERHVSKRQFDSIQIHVGGSKINSLVPPLTNTEMDKSACDIDDTASVKTTSITGSSLPESPLPSSSMSYSSEILPSSDIEDTLISSESDFSVNSHASMLITEVTSEDEDRVNKQTVIQNKITSLVESLRNRLTQDTSNLPPWIASINKSATETKVKKRKILKMNVKKKVLRCNTAHEQVGGDISSSVTETCSAISFLSSPVLSSLLPSPSTSSLCLATQSFSLNTLPSVVTSSSPAVNLPPSDYKEDARNCQILPVPEKVGHQPFENHAGALENWDTSKSDHLLVDKCASNDMIDEKASSEIKDIIEIDDASSNRKCIAITGAFSELTAGKSLSDFCAHKNNLSNDHLDTGLFDTDLTACSEAQNPNRQSPVDYEIEIGNEDLPETALSLQLILPNEDLNIEALKLNRRKHKRECDPNFSSPDIVNGFHLQDGDIRQLHPVNNLQKNTSSLSKLEICKAQHSKGKKSLMNTGSCINDCHIDKLQSSESESRPGGSVASYLCKKFSFQGKINNVKGPRLLNRPSTKIPNITNTSKQNVPVQSTFNALTQVEPITTEELFKTPSLDEIFGASIDSELMTDPENKEDSLTNCASQISLNNNGKTQQRRVHPDTSRAQISKKRNQLKRKRKGAQFLPDIPHLATAFQPNSVLYDINPTHPNLMSLSISKTSPGSELVANMNVCKVVLTKLELSNLDRLSENVFIIRDETAMKKKPQVKVTNIDSDTLQANISKSTFKRVVKKKGRKITRPGFRRKGDVIDYYAYMLETLQKKALQLEEETRKKEAEACAKKVQLESIRCEEVKELEQSTDPNKREEIATQSEIITGQGTNNTDMEEVVKKGSSKGVCSIKIEVNNCISQPPENIASSLDAHINTVSTNGKGEPTFNSALECDILSEKTENKDATNCVHLTEEASKKDHEACVQSEVVNVSDSDWPYLQKFCDETIFNPANIDYLQKVNKDICFPSINESSELKFEKKDIVLCSNMNERVGLELNLCETFSNTEDTSGCIEQCTDEQEIDNMDEDGILLGLKFKQSSEFNCDDQEKRKLSLSQSPTDMHISSLDDGTIVDANCKSGNTSSEENISSAVNNNIENAQSVPVSCQLESTYTLKGTASTAISQSLTEQNVTLKNEKSQRTVDISPSWERLLGRNSMDISDQESNDTSTSHPETSQNHDVSFVASSNFKLKFKLPRGILSKALQLSRDMKNVLFENPAPTETLLSNSEASPHKSLDESSKNSSNPHNTCGKITENDALQLSKDMKNVIENPAPTETFLSNSVVSPHKSLVEISKNSSNPHNTCRKLTENEALQLSRDMKNVIENPAPAETLVSNSEVSPHKSDEISKNNSNPYDKCRKLTENEVFSDCVTTTPCENQKGHKISQIPVSKLKFSSVTLNAIQRAKAEFLQKRTSAKRSNEGPTSENMANTLDDEQAHSADLLCDTNTLICEESCDHHDRKFAPDGVSSISSQDNELSKRFLGGVCCDLTLNERSQQFSSNNANIECREVEVHAKDVSVSESVSSVDDLTTNSGLPSVCLKQRKDGIFSNLNLFQGCDADAPKEANEQSLNKQVTKEASEQSSSKGVQNDNISKVNVIDIKKLKLKLNPLLLGKLKKNTEKSVTTVQHSASISSAFIEKFAKTSFHKLQQKLKPHILAKQKVAKVTVHTSQQLEECTPVPKTMLHPSGLESVALLDSQEQSSESDSLNVLKQNGPDNKLDANISLSRPVNSSSEMADLVTVSTHKQLPQVNTAKLCTILKNFHKTGSISNSVPTNPEGALLNCSQGDADLHVPNLQRSLRKSKLLSSAAKSAVVEAGAGCRTRGKRKKCQSESHGTMTNTDREKAKKVKQTIPTNSFVPGIPQEHLVEGHDGSVCNNEQLDSEDKGERSFFDCLSSVPLDTWE